MRSQPRETLLAHTADPYQQPVAPLRPQDPRQPAEMLDRVGEEYQAHVLGRDQAVIVEVVLQHGLGALELDNLLVDALIALRAEHQEVAEQQERRLGDEGLVVGGQGYDLVAEGMRADAREEAVEVALVLGVYQAVVEDAEALVIEESGWRYKMYFSCIFCYVYFFYNEFLVVWKTSYVVESIKKH